MMDLFLTNMQLFTLEDVNWSTGVMLITCGLLWCFLSVVWTHFNGTHLLQMIHWYASDKQVSNLNMDDQRVSHFSVNYFFKRCTYNIKSTICLNNIDMFYSKMQYEADKSKYSMSLAGCEDWRNFAVYCGSEKSPGVKVVSCWEHLYHKTLSPNPQPLTSKVSVDILLISGNS